MRWMVLAATVGAIGAAQAQNLDLPSAAMAEELAELSTADAPRRSRLHIRQDVDWTAFRTVHVASPTFALDPEYFTETYDHAARARINRSLTEGDQEHLAGRFRIDLGQAVGRLAEVSDSPDGVDLYVQPIITGAERSRPSVEELGSRVGLQMGSIYAGTVTARINIREGGPEGPLLMSFWSTHDDARLNDGRFRNVEWSDAYYGFVTLANRMRRVLKKQGLNGESA